MTTPKIPLREIDSSECVVYVGRTAEGGVVVEEGTPYKVHDGEWVKVLPVVSVSEFLDYITLVRGDAFESGPAFERVLQELSKRVVEWNWTDMMSKPLPQPYDNPEVIRSLSAFEIMWLLKNTGPETGAEAKNDSEPLPGTQSGEGRRQKKHG